MEYTHFETSEPFEPITGKRPTSPPTFHLVSPFPQTPLPPLTSRMADKADAFAMVTSMDDAQNGNICDAAAFFA